MRVLITGIRGFVGQNLMHYLVSKGFKVVGVSRRNEEKSEIVSWEALAKQTINADAWVHLAGKAHDVTGNQDQNEYIQVNLELTKIVFNYFLDDSIAHTFIYFSSVKAVASSVEGVLKEGDSFQVDNPYGASKRAAEQFLLSQKLPKGKKLVILRPCMIHGPGNKGNLNLLYKVVQKGLPYPLAAFHNERSFLSIDNLVFSIQKIISDAQFPSGVYHIADDDSFSTNELVQLIANTIGQKAKLWHFPKSLVNGLAKIGDILRLPLNSHRLQKLTESYLVSNEKIKIALRVERFPISAKKGLVKTIKSFER